MKYTEVTTMDVYRQYGSLWHLSLLIKLLNSSHEDDGVNLYNWMFV